MKTGLCQEESHLRDDCLGRYDHLITVNIQKIQLPLPQQAEHQRLQTLLKSTDKRTRKYRVLKH